MKSAGHACFRKLLADGRLAITPEHLAAAIKEADATGQSLTRTLVTLGLADESALLRELGGHLNMPWADLTPERIESAAVTLVPAKVVEHYRIMPVAIANNHLQVAVSDPFDYDLLDELALVLGRPVRAMLAPAAEILKAARRHYGVGAETLERLVAEEGGAGLEHVATGGGQNDLAHESQAQQASVIKLVNQILLDAIKERATDIHLEPYEDELRVRYRVDGLLREAGVPPAARHFRAAIVSRIKIMANLDIAEKRLPQDGRAQVRLADEPFDLRVSILPVAEGEGISIRILSRSGSFNDLASLGLEESDRDRLAGLLDQPHGIILVTGPTGSGKTTTLYACLNRLNRPQTKILTIEDPIEYRIRGVQQMQVASDIGFTFARALRSMLRHDPDIMLIGEIRDAETAEIAIRTSLTGHLVFSTLHTNDAAGGVTRLTDMGIEPYLISSSVLGMVAQRLVRTICPHCREEHRYDPALVAALARESGQADRPGALFRGRGCEQCRLSGYRGRTAIYEIMLMSETIQQLTQSRRPAGEIRAVARREGMRTLRQAGWAKVCQGQTTIDEVLRVTQDEPGTGPGENGLNEPAG